MVRFCTGEYEVCCQNGGFPPALSDYRQRAALSDDFAAGEGSELFVSVGRGQQWPFLVVTQRFSPAGDEFFPGVLLAPDAHRLFLGAGRRLVCYDLTRLCRVWEDQAECGFWSWSRHGAVVLMAAELELAAWDVSGRKLWSRFVEPPWEYAVAGDVVAVNVMGTTSRVRIRSGSLA